MKKNILFKNKFQMVIYTILFIVLIALFIVISKMDFNSSVTDAVKFSNTFSMVPTDNVFIYATATDARMVASGNKGIVLFGTSNEWVNYYAYMVNEIAKEVGIDEIYYYDFLKNRSDNNGTYEDIVNKLSDYVTVNDRGVAEIYAPTLLVVSKDKVIYFDNETSFVEGSITPASYWRDSKILEKEDALREVFEEYMED